MGIATTPAVKTFLPIPYPLILSAKIVNDVEALKRSSIMNLQTPSSILC